MRKIHNRITAGRELAEKLIVYNSRSDVIVLALPRGGVPVGYQIAQRLHVKFDAFLVRKLGVPNQPELAFGAIAMGDVTVFNQDIVSSLGITKEIIKFVSEKESKELQRRNDLYRQGRSAPLIKGQTVILVDDGLATGATMRAAIMAIKKMQPAAIIVAVPVTPYDTYLEFQESVDDIISLEIPEPFYSISLWYDEFPQISDEEVCELLQGQ